MTRWLAISLLSGFAALAGAQGLPHEGVDYVRLTTAQTTESPGKIEVIEFFGYWCPHCNAFEPLLHDWAKRQGADVVVRYVPVAFNDAQVPLQRLYYTLDVLGKESELRAKVFAAIHVDHNPLDTLELQTEFAAKNGIDKKKYTDLYKSFSVQTRTRGASQMRELYAIDSVPTLSIQGKYTTGGAPNTFATVDYLVNLERKLLPKAAPGK